MNKRTNVPAWDRQSSYLGPLKGREAWIVYGTMVISGIAIVAGLVALWVTR